MRKLTFLLALVWSGVVFSANPILCNELSIDPLGRGYAAMDSQGKASDLNTEYRTKWKECVNGADLLDAIEAADWNLITDNQRDRAWALLAVGCLDPQKNVRTLMIRIFGSGSDTIANMAGISQEAITRAQELGISRVKAGHVEECQ